MLTRVSLGLLFRDVLGVQHSPYISILYIFTNKIYLYFFFSKHMRQRNRHKTDTDTLPYKQTQMQATNNSLHYTHQHALYDLINDSVTLFVTAPPPLFLSSTISFSNFPLFSNSLL